MFTKATFALTLVLATASGALAATKHPDAALKNAYNSAAVATVYNPSGHYVGTDPDAAVRFELQRDWGRGN